MRIRSAIGRLLRKLNSASLREIEGVKSEIDALRNDVWLTNAMIALPSELRSTVIAIRNQISPWHVSWDSLVSSPIFRHLSSNVRRLEWIHDRLADELSRQCLVWQASYALFVYAFGGPTDLWWYFMRENPAKVAFMKMIHDAIGSGLHPLEGFVLPESYLQYQLAGISEVKEGDVVFDGGASTGAEAATFSHMVGESGRVFCFESNARNHQVLQERSIPRCVALQVALHDCETELSFTEEGLSGSGRLGAKGIVKVKTTTIDKVVSEYHLSRLNLIKMDIEGAELAALRGGTESIHRFVPDLAICAYHNECRDLIDVPYYLMTEYGDIYDFYFRYHTPGWGEAVLHCVPRNKEAAVAVRLG